MIFMNKEGKNQTGINIKPEIRFKQFQTESLLLNYGTK